jgi:hypothetical protein
MPKAPRWLPGGNVQLLAEITTDLDSVAGGLVAVRCIGAAASISVLSKDTQAYVGDHASVDALGNGTSADRFYTGDRPSPTTIFSDYAPAPIAGWRPGRPATALSLGGRVGAAYLPREEASAWRWSIGHHGVYWQRGRYHRRTAPVVTSAAPILPNP